MSATPAPRHTYGRPRPAEPSTPPQTQPERVSNNSSSDEDEEEMEVGVSGGDLTPRSKIRAMLAKYDTQPTQTQAYQKSSSDEEEEEEDDEDEVRPRGKMAARMKGKNISTAKPGPQSPPTAPVTENGVQDKEDGLTAYERVKRSLLAPKTKATAKEDHPVPDGGMNTEQAPSPPRRALKKRAPKSVISNDSDSDSSITKRMNAFKAPETDAIRAVSESDSEGEMRIGGASDDDDEDELPTATEGVERSRLQALIAKKRAEREAAEEAERAKREANAAAEPQLFSDDGSDEEEKGKVVKERKPRAASKKAMEEMHKETLRMERSMALAPEVYVKKKVSMGDFFKKFGYKGGKKDEPVAEEAATPALPVQDEQTVVSEETKKALERAAPVLETEEPEQPKNQIRQAAFEMEDDSDMELDLPSAVEALSSQAAPKSSPAKPPAPAPSAATSVLTKAARIAKTKFTEIVLDDSDEEGEDEEKSVSIHSQVLARAKASRATNSAITKDQQLLKRLAGVSRKGKTAPNAAPAMSKADLNKQLLMAAGMQAKLEREEKEAELRAKGIYKSVEEHVKEEEAVMDLVEKAREQAEKIKKMEDAKKKEKKEEGGEDDDGDWDMEEEEEEASAEESNSEDGDSDADEGENRDFSDEEGSESGEEEENDENVPPSPSALTSTRPGVGLLPAAMESDDEDDSIAVVKPRALRRIRALDDEDEAEGVEPTGDGLTQFFATGTTVNSVTPRRAATLSDTPQNAWSLEYEDVVLATQNQATQVLAEVDATQVSVFAPPSPGVQSSQPEAAAPRRFANNMESTQADPTQIDEVSLPRKGRLMQRQATAEDDDESSAFNVMRRAAKKHKAKEVKDMSEKEQERIRGFVEEQAEESEDEYAGLDGGDDEVDLGTGSDLEDLIDHETQDVDDTGLAAFYAQKELDSDTKAISDLLNDITNGGLRRKRGGRMMDLDSDDEDEEDEEIARERYNRRLQAMRKKLLEDEKLSNLANNPKMSAFLAAIEDRGMQKEKSFLDEEYDEDVEMADDEESQAQVQVNATQEDSLPVTIADPQGSRMMPAPLLKKKSVREIDVRETLAFLYEDSQTTQIIESDDEEDVTIESSISSSVAVVDRASQKRASVTASSSVKMAFGGAHATQPVFRVPSLPHQTSSFYSDTSDSQRTTSSEGLRRIAKAGARSSSRAVTFMAKQRVTKGGLSAKEVDEEKLKAERVKKDERRKTVMGLFSGKGSFA
ncbi:hypothetical protein G7K_2213-t1 [Saitoella complicata NRRL Y-17804]|uniref:Elongation factor 1 beta central acidic region eukaryote domain-containing protein n=2 Tax=Saitoella complicata (strain BCRC 22490 / CBS 7301 / JCM 7358 / NBRC 10748 / NRRL Y-17804) TaxID=698492 RepID=A0A0E9NF50_SAICN|nr:hypothetical protein G7K_2213-t1 [Saitoella complicata NRRL Y-17804]